MSAFHLHINIIESEARSDFSSHSSRFSSLGASPRAGKLGSRHAATRAQELLRFRRTRRRHAPMMSRPLVSTIATVDRADAPKSNQKGEEKSGLSY
jgi:hypothetical protein